jgi:hypothetical protein
MWKFAIAVLAALTVLQPARLLAGDQPNSSGTKPSSLVPHAHTKNHVYGSPIQPAILGHARNSHRKRAPQKRSSGTTNNNKQ